MPTRMSTGKKKHIRRSWMVPSQVPSQRWIFMDQEMNREKNQLWHLNLFLSVCPSVCLWLVGSNFCLLLCVCLQIHFSISFFLIWSILSGYSFLELSWFLILFTALIVFFLLVWGIGFDVVIIVIVIFDLPMEFHCNRHTQPVMEQWKQRNDYSALVNGEGARTYRFRHIGTVGFHLEEKKEKGWKMPRPWTMFDAPPSLSSFPV